MAVSKMKRLSLLVMGRDAEKMTKRLMRLSCVEVTRAEEQTLPPPDIGEKITKTEQSKALVGQAIAHLTPLSKSKKGLFEKRTPIDYERLTADTDTPISALDAAQQVLDAVYTRQQCKEKITVLESEIRQLQPWKHYELPFSETGTLSVGLRYGFIAQNGDPDLLLEPVLESLEAPPSLVIHTVSGGEEKGQDRFVTVLYRKNEELAAMDVLSRIGFTALDMSGYSSSAAEEIGHREETVASLREQIGAQEERLLALTDRLKDLKLAHDMLDTDLAQLEAQNRLLRTESTALLRGWVPEGAVPDVERLLSDMTCAWEISDPEEGEEPPVLLKNHKHLEPFEMVIGMYAYPKYGSFDPTFVMSIFYFIIFGAMLADFVYGLIVSAICFAAMKFLDLQGGVRRMVKLFAICGISCMIMGVLMGSYLGDLPVAVMKNMLGIENPPSLAILFDPVNDPISFLIFALIIGGVHLLFGMGIKAYVLIKTGHKWAALFDVGSWYVLFAGIGLLFVSTPIGAAFTAIGAGMLLFSQGRDKKNIFGKAAGGLLSLYKIVNYGSDLLSYSRIMALGMSSAVIANVVNVIATLNGPSVAGWLMLIIIVPIGTALNLAINLLGSFVHTSRLQYIEFFDKFYESGGQPFEPLSPRARYTVLKEEADRTEAK